MVWAVRISPEPCSVGNPAQCFNRPRHGDDEDASRLKGMVVGAVISRRRFVLFGLGVGSTVGAFAVPAGAAATPSPTTATLWRLSADWGYPAGPKGRTRCKGRACHLHAANKIYATEADALAGRLHICCMAQPVAFEVPIEVHHELTSLPPSPGPALGDRRHDEVVQALERAALAAHESSHHAAPPSRPPATLASTGSSVAMLTAGGVALGTLGATALAISRRNEATDDQLRCPGPARSTGSPS